MAQNSYKDHLIDNDIDEEFINPSIHKKIKLDPTLNIAIMASGNGSNLEAIYNSIINGELNAKISILIVNKNNCKAIERAKRLGIKYIYLDHKQFKSRETYDRNIVDILKNYDIEAVIMAGWMRIVTPTLINSYPNKIINIHPSLLPSYKGINSIQRALEAKIKITGCTVHKVIDQVDSGEIICQAAVKILENDTTETLTKRIQSQEHIILPKAIALAANEWRSINYG